ncbi:hypothetical protein C5167_007699 [Papaver somniferum]|uniref:uncharacterized protein LOC113344731 n=1 Tax=Papaver somniferum TaxID=3469 RepID=UPI000E6FBE04|nr:uncharacterized protein LOC113344731 [Papaver somniferum]RZC93660.1 hypothetical protein C5167_007699 [Papaver somniferum]
MRGIMGSSSISLLLLPPPTSKFNLRKTSFSIKSSNPSLNSSSLKTRTFSPYPSHKNTQIWRISAANEGVAVSKQVETVQKIITSNEDTGVSTTISVLLFIAFVGLTILTIGVIYIAVTDFLTKREREKYEKAESEKKKKKVVRSRVGPKGFGQKPDDFDDF